VWQDGDANTAAGGVTQRTSASVELLQFTDKYLDADDGPKGLDDKRQYHHRKELASLTLQL